METTALETGENMDIMTPGVVSNGNSIFVTSFDEGTSSSFVTSVMSIAEKNEHDPITLYINSYGGALHELFSMLSVMDSVANPFVTVCTGKAMSAGAVLLSHGDIRCIGPHAKVMIHQASGGFGGHVEDVKIDAKELASVNHQALRILASNCGKSIKTLKQAWIKGRDVYLNPKQALEFGLVDYIGIPIIQRRTAFDLKFAGPKK